jgi:hypothetical protein
MREENEYTLTHRRNGWSNYFGVKPKRFLVPYPCNLSVDLVTDVNPEKKMQNLINIEFFSYELYLAHCYRMECSIQLFSVEGLINMPVKWSCRKSASELL